MKHFVTLLFSFTVCARGLAQIPNSGMEIWDNQPVLSGWETNSYPLTQPAWEPYIVRKDTGAYSGNWAADLYGNGFLKPYAKTTFALQQHPVSLSLFYRLSFAPCVNDPNYPEKDTVSVLVEILNNGIAVDKGYWESTVTRFNYTQLAIPLSQSATAFDSCHIKITGGNNYGGCGIVAAPTQFWVDELQLQYAGGCIDSSQICVSCPCPGVYNPVCGCNGITYSNSCLAENDGVIAYTSGACNSSGAGACLASFSFFKQLDTVSFYNTSSAAVITGYQWFFGDGDSSGQQNPVHHYVHDSTYTVCLYLSAVDSSGNPCNSYQCRTLTITHACIDSSLICPDFLCCDFAPPVAVCGCDSVTYYNACEAQGYHGVNLYYPGPCVSTGVYDGAGADRFSLMPNPTNGASELKFELLHAADTEITVSDMLGRIMQQQPLGDLNAGVHTVKCNTGVLNPGLYIVQLKLNGRTVTSRKLVRE